MIRNGNPIFSSVNMNYNEVSESQATYKGVTIKTLLLLGLVGIAAIVSAMILYGGEALAPYLALLIISSIVGFIVVLIGRLNPRASMVCSIIYAVCEGMLVGSLTALVDLFYEGAVFLAVVATGLIFLSTLILFACGFLRNVGLLRGILMTLLIGIIFMSLVLFICRIAHIPGVSTLLSNNLGLSVILSAIFLVYGAITLALNFNEVTAYVQVGAPREFEWTAAFGLVVSIVYIFIEALRLIVILMDRRN